MTTQQKKILTYFVILALVCLLILSSAWFLLFRINQMAGKIKEVKTNLVSWQKKEVYSRQMSEEYEKILTNLEMVNQGFLSPNEIINFNFIEKLEKLAQEIPLTQKINNAQIKEEKPASLTLDLALEGDFPKILQYLILLENMEYYNKITKLQLNKTAQQSIFSPSGEPTTNPSPLKATLELIVFLTAKK